MTHRLKRAGDVAARSFSPAVEGFIVKTTCRFLQICIHYRATFAYMYMKRFAEIKCVKWEVDRNNLSEIRKNAPAEWTTCTTPRDCRADGLLEQRLLCIDWWVRCTRRLRTARALRRSRVECWCAPENSTAGCSIHRLWMLFVARDNRTDATLHEDLRRNQPLRICYVPKNTIHRRQSCRVDKLNLRCTW